MNAEIISVGTEIILGDILNTHSQYLSQELAHLGINVYYQTAVGDNDKRFTSILKTAISRSDLIILTGGLGPTTDDITKEVACELLGVKCYLDENILNKIKTYFEKSGRIMSNNNTKQAMVPENSIVLENNCGTAPGFIINKDGKTVVLLPGPPRELRPMFEEKVKPYLKYNSKDVIVSKNVRVFGIGESDLEPKISKIVKQINPTVALYAKEGEVLIRVTSKSSDEKQANLLIDKTIDELYSILGNYIYGINKESLQQVLVEELIKQNKTIATAESCTGGMLASKLTQISGVSAVFNMGVITYENWVKRDLIDVTDDSLSKYGAVSQEVATEMAVGLAKKSNADFSVSITGIAGPSGGSKEKPVGTVYIAVCHKQKVWCKRYNFARNKNEREYIRNLACLNAMNMVRLTLIDEKTFEDSYI